MVNTNPAYTYDYAYDRHHRLKRWSTSLVHKSLAYEYTEAGLLTTMTDSEGGQTDYLYDPVGRLTGIWAPNYDYLAFGYDPGGRLTERWSPNSVKSPR